MKITEVVQHVERNKLPRDAEWLRNRIFHLISLLRFHHKQLKVLVPEAEAFAESSTSPERYRVSTVNTDFKITITHKNPVFAQPLYDILNVLQGTSQRITEYTRPRLFQLVPIKEGFPKLERFLYHVRAYEHVQEDLERTVRSAALFNKS